MNSYQNRHMASVARVGAFCAIVGAMTAQNIQKTQRQRRDNAVAYREVANVSYMALWSVRNGGTNSMIPGIEGVLDRGVCGIWNHRAGLTDDERTAATLLLRKVKEYRERYPRSRSPESGILTIENQSDAILRDCE